MNINTFIKAFLIGCFLIGLQSCSDFLEEEPRGLQTIDGAFQDENSARLVLNGMYDAITWGESSSNGFSGHSYEFIIGDICSDDAEKGSNDADQIDIQRLKEFNTNGANGNVTTLWGKYWVAINRANVVLLSLQGSNLDANVVSQFEGEAKFVRAYAYLHLVTIFGGVPRFESPVGSEEINDRSFTRASIAEIYNLIDSDLNFAKDVLPKKGDVDPGIATSGAAAAYLARSIMYQLGTENGSNYSWSNLLTITDEIMNGDYGAYRLASNYASIWSVEGENNEESIWEIQSIDNGLSSFERGPSTGSMWTLFQSPFFMGGWGFNTPTADLAESFEDNDPRRACTAITLGEHAFGVEMVPNERNKTGYFHRKAILDPAVWNTQKGSEANLRRFRYADVILMNAEAAYHAGNTTKAISDLEMIRDRASFSTFPQGYDPDDIYGYMATGYAPLDNSIIPQSGQDLLDFIYLERRRELGMETLRFMDLVRTGRYAQVIGETYNNNSDPNDTEFANRVLSSLSTVTVSSSSGNPIPLFPIPTKDLEDWGISQNAGY